MSKAPNTKQIVVSLMTKSVIALIIAGVICLYLNDRLTTYIIQSRDQLTTIRSDLGNQRQDIKKMLTTSLEIISRKHPGTKITTLKTKDGDLRAVIIAPPTVSVTETPIPEEKASNISQSDLQELNDLREKTQ